MRSVITTTLVIVAIYLGYGMFLYVVQRSMIYFPTPRVAHEFEEETFHTGESINVIVTNPGAARAVMYFGGNADALAMSAPGFDAVLPDMTVYFVHYRGYGGSTGKPTEQGIYHDALTIHDAIRERHDAISVIGRSLGSGVATYMATRRDIDKLILITPFDSAVNMAQGLFPIYPARLIVKDRYDSIGRANGIDLPTLVLIAQNDSVIPRKRSMNLVASLDPAITEAHVLPGTDHNDIAWHPGYYDRILEFLRR